MSSESRLVFLAAHCNGFIKQQQALNLEISKLQLESTHGLSLEFMITLLSLQWFRLKPL